MKLTTKNVWVRIAFPFGLDTYREYRTVSLCGLFWRGIFTIFCILLTSAIVSLALTEILLNVWDFLYGVLTVLSVVGVFAALVTIAVLIGIGTEKFEKYRDQVEDEQETGAQYDIPLPIRGLIAVKSKVCPIIRIENV